MRRDIINAGALQDAVDHALEGGPLALRGRWPEVGAYVRRAAEEHETVRKAHRRKNDPAWALAKFAEGRTLHRFRERDPEALLFEIGRCLSALEQVAALAEDRRDSIAQEAAAFLRGLTHERPRFGVLHLRIEGLLGRARSAALRARRDEILRRPAEISAGGLTGTRCGSVRAIVSLGREARNCLAGQETYWEEFVSGTIDIWGLRAGDRLVAVLRVKRDGSLAVEAQGPANQPVGVHDVREVALFCRAAGLTIGRGCEGLLPDYAALPLLAPRVVSLGREVALYAEWPTAVRIDLSGGVDLSEDWDGRTRRTLALAFDPARPLVAAVLDGPDPRDAVKAFGRKALRRIVRIAALEQAEPSLVQHRLLALAA